MLAVIVVIEFWEHTWVSLPQVGHSWRDSPLSQVVSTFLPYPFTIWNENPTKKWHVLLGIPRNSLKNPGLYLSSRGNSGVQEPSPKNLQSNCGFSKISRFWNTIRCHKSQGFPKNLHIIHWNPVRCSQISQTVHLWHHRYQLWLQDDLPRKGSCGKRWSFELLLVIINGLLMDY